MFSKKNDTAGKGPSLTRITTEMFYVDNIRDVEWNPDPFSTLVLPDGYKDLVLSFVEAHVGGDQQPVGDVVRGKGKPQ